MSQLSLDARVILEYLNELGYRNITADQLKEFMKDLRKLIKYEELICWEEQHVDIFERLFQQRTKSFQAKIYHNHGRTMEERQSDIIRESRSLSRANEGNTRSSGNVARQSRTEVAQPHDRLGSRGASVLPNNINLDGERYVRASSIANNGDNNKENEFRYRSSSRNDLRQSVSSNRSVAPPSSTRASRIETTNAQSRNEPDYEEAGPPATRLSRRDMMDSKGERQSEINVDNYGATQRESEVNLRASQFGPTTENQQSDSLRRSRQDLRRSQSRQEPGLPQVDLDNYGSTQRESEVNLRSSQFGPTIESEQPDSSRRSRQDLRRSQSRQEPDLPQVRPSTSRALSRQDIRASQSEDQQKDRTSSYSLTKLSSSPYENPEVVMNSTKFVQGKGVEATHAASEVLQDITSTIPQRQSSNAMRSPTRVRNSRQKKLQDEEDAAREELVKNLFMGTGLIKDETKEGNTRNGQLRNLLTWNEIQERFRQKIKEDELNATRDRTRDEFEWELLAAKGKGTLIPRYQSKGRPFRPHFQDPVSLYHWYQREWAFFRNRIPGEATHSEVRWNIRQKFLDPQPIVRHTRRAMALQPKNDKQPYLTFMGCDFTRS